MANLIHDLTPGYCNELMPGAMFLKDGEPHVFREADYEGQHVYCRKYSTTADRVTTKAVQVPSTFFKGWAAFEFPILGYRMAANGQLLAYVSRNNSVRRGLHIEDARVDLHEVSYQCENIFGLGLDHYTRGNGKVPLILCPQYMTYTEGMAKILNGEIPSFALSPDFAVAPNEKIPFLEILFRQRRVGTIDENGNAEITMSGMVPSWKHTIKEI